MARRNPTGYPEGIQAIVKRLSEYKGDEVQEVRVDLGDRALARKRQYTIYGYLSALEDYTKHGNEELRLNRIMSANFKQNYGLKVENGTLVFVPKRDWYGKDDPMKAVLAQLPLAAPVAFTMDRDVGITPPRKSQDQKIHEEAQTTLLHMRLQAAEGPSGDEMMASVLKQLSSSSSPVATPQLGGPQLGLDSEAQGPIMSESAPEAGNTESQALTPTQEGSK